MKKYFNYLIIALIVQSNVGCDEFLKTESNSTFNEKTIFVNLDFATKAVNGIYANLAQDNLFGYSYLWYHIDSDIEMSFFPENNSFVGISHYTANPGNTSLLSTWAILYNTIERANICIEGLPISPIWEGEYADEARRLYAEAITMRAWCYNELISNWGDVPYKRKATQSGDDYYIPKSDRDSIYEEIIEDIKVTEDYLPWLSRSKNAGRVSKGFAKGLRARLALTYAGYSLRNKTFETKRGRKWEAYYQIARQECMEVLAENQHQLDPSFINIFKSLHAYKPDYTYYEIMFEVPFGRTVSGRIAEVVGMNHNTNDPKYGRASNLFGVPPTFFYSFDKVDSRRNVSVELYNYSFSTRPGQQMPTTINMTPNKWRKSWINPPMGGDLKEVYLTGINWPLMRYSDIILMLAEAENQVNGPTQIAKDALAMVRKRAFPENEWQTKVTAYIDSVDNDKDAFFNAIVNERAWEFGGEFLRKRDLVRWNLLGSKIREMKDNCKKILDKQPPYDYLPNYIFWKHKADGETIEILNPDYFLPENPIEGYTRNGWLSGNSVGIQSTFYTKLGYVAKGYVEAKNNHLLPIAETIITQSNGVLTNDQIPE